jgi:hypothetical protein
MVLANYYGKREEDMNRRKADTKLLEVHTYWAKLKKGL